MKNVSFQPSFEEFKRYARQGNLVPVFVDVLADTLTPVSLLASGWNKSDHCFLLESVEGGEKLGRYSILSFKPELILEGQSGSSRFLTPEGKTYKNFQRPALESLQQYMRGIKSVAIPGLPRFFGGAVGYLSYENVHNIERLPKTKPDLLNWPEALFLVTGDLFVFDNTQQMLKLITCVRLEKKTNVKKAYNLACRRLRKNLEWISSHRHAKPKPGLSKKRSPFESNVSRDDFMASVRRAKAHIGKGDIIQVVLSRRQEKDTTASPLDIYRSLRVVNPSPYMYVLKMKDRSIIGSSPEPLVRLENGTATTRPIAGTRRRGETFEKDQKMEKELLSDPKERAEHLMLVDLGRNDLGRVCKPGSVRVPSFMVVERYSHVMHIVSEVSGRLKSNKDGFDLLKSAFPAGTVAGAPKIRAMEIIDDLEPCQRGPYSGALGYFSYSGNMDMAITIRTILWENGRVSIQTGAGLVADSNPALEYMETESKAAGMKRAVELAESGTLLTRIT